MNKKLKFTKTEQRILDHRLGVPDAIAEAIGISYDFAFEVCKGIEAKITKESSYGTLEQTILEDCCSGCTMFADIDEAVAIGEINVGTKMSMMKAAYSLSDKVGVQVQMI